MKKRFSFGICIPMLVMLFVCTISVSAYTINPASETVRGYKQVYEAIYKAIDAQQSYLDVERWRIQDYDIMTIFSDVMHNSPEFFYADNKLVYRYDRKGYVTSLSFSYHMSRTKRGEATALYEAEISTMVHEVEAVGLSGAEAALYVHDMLIAAYSYDESEEIFDVYRFLTEKKGVCQAYSLCYMAVLRKLGIPCFMVVSEEMNHSWNLLEIDGQWYHVDLTYDDPRPDRPGQVYHDHFLLSDTSIFGDRGQGNHWGWESTKICGDETYTNACWQDSDTRMLFANDTWYMLSETSGILKRVYFDGSLYKELYALPDIWYVDPVKNSGERWLGYFTGLGIYNGYIYYNSPQHIWRLNPATGEKVSFLTLEEEGLNLYGMHIWQGEMTYLVGSTPDRDATAYMETVAMQYSEQSEPKTVESVFLPFQDVNRVSPYYKAVEYLYKNGIMTGTAADTFGGTGIMTRAQFAALLSRLYDYYPSEYQGEVLYTDVPADSWYAPYVSWVTGSGYMRGMGGGTFAPNDPVSREQMFNILATVCRSQKLGVTETTALGCIDRATIGPWALAGVDFCWTNGLMADKYTFAFAPKSSVKRNEAADALYRLCLLREKK